MRTEGAPAGTSVHATAVAIGGRALAIVGPSRSGKSTLAATLLARSTAERPIELIGDDRVLLIEAADGVMVRPHPRIAGFMERRGLGIVSTAYRPQAFLGGAVDLGPTTLPDRLLGSGLPTLSLAAVPGSASRADRVLDWWDRGRRGKRTTLLPENAGA